MIGNFKSGYNLLNSYPSDTIKNLQPERLNENTYSSRIGVFPEKLTLD